MLCRECFLFSFTVMSQLSTDQTHLFTNAFKKNLAKVIEHCCSVAITGGVFTSSDYQPPNDVPYIEHNSDAPSDCPLLLLPLGDQGYEIYLNTLLPQLPESIYAILFEADKAGDFKDFDSHADFIVNTLINDELLKKGQCSLIGWSYGAVLAHIISVKLMERGINVHHCFLIDPLSPGHLGIETYTKWLSQNNLSFL